ncbi:MAG TPA: YbjN domain-containing protein [Stellaceae bacterium]|nr:YbjN domain-containing protein [Stellaceae bacterium]
MAVGATATSAKDLPAGGLTVEEVAQWLQADGYQAKIVTEKNGAKTITSSSGGVNFHIGFYDCRSERCASLQFFAGFDTHGALNPVKMNEWNHTKRWARGYVDQVDDPWIEMDVDLSPGGTYDILNDEFAIWRNVLGDFSRFIRSS